MMPQSVCPLGGQYAAVKAPDNGFLASGRCAVIVIQQPAQALPPLDCACLPAVARLRVDDAVLESLVIAFFQVMTYELGSGALQ